MAMGELELLFDGIESIMRNRVGKRRVKAKGTGHQAPDSTTSKPQGASQSDRYNLLKLELDVNRKLLDWTSWNIINSTRIVIVLRYGRTFRVAK